MLVDDGYTGTNFQRPGVQEGFELVKQGLVGCWLCKDLSRFGRDYLTVGQYTDIIFPSYDVRFIAVNDGVDSQRGDGEGFAAIRNLFNEWYPRDTSKKVRTSLRQRGTSGKHLGKPPYGYRCDPNDKDKWILDEDAAPIVKRIFDLCIDGKGPEQISRILERDQVLTTKALYASRKGKPLPKNPYGWSDQSIVGILERQGLFAGLVYCADCGSKLHFATCKGFEGKQDHYRCSKYKSGRGECSAHYIREDVLRELVQERIQAVNEYIRSDVEGFQEEWLHYRRADQERDIREDQKRMEQAKKRLATLDVVISRLYEDYALGEISKEKHKKMTSDYEAEQERLKLEIETTEEWVEQRQAMGDDLDAFIALTKKYVDVTELTQTIVNEYIRKIVIHAPDKSSGKCRQKVEIFFNFVDDVEIPVLAEPMIAESTLGRRKTA